MYEEIEIEATKVYEYSKRKKEEILQKAIQKAIQDRGRVVILPDGSEIYSLFGVDLVVLTKPNLKIKSEGKDSKLVFSQSYKILI